MWTNSIPWKKRKEGNENLLNLNLTIPQNKISAFHLRLSLLRRLKIAGLHSRNTKRRPSSALARSLIEVSVAIEGMFYKENISNIDLSEQQIIDGCHGIDDKGIEVDKFIENFRKNPSITMIGHKLTHKRMGSVVAVQVSFPRGQCSILCIRLVG
ncbi:hypothetical protein V2J09_001487 [Rumex salicifolius]